MRELEQIHFRSREEFRDWLECNHDASSGFKMLFYKKHTNKPNISYEEAVEEAICFGWIDSTVNRIDEEKYTRTFYPRTNVSNWSDVNKRRAIKMYKANKMETAGLKKIDVYNKTGKLDWGKIPERQKKTVLIPEFIQSQLKSHEPAWENFSQLPPSHKRNYIQWITAAKKEATKLKRTKEAIELLKKNKKLGMK